ncbi:MAG TPA: Dabb family protein [Saprospiraceae bacterium]|nr:Dabb family protein [Saprospiraceae bacterium]
MNKMSRRDFVKNSAFAVAAAATPLTASATDAKKKEVFVHHVYFWLKNPGNEADKNKLIEGLQTLTKVPTIRMAHIGTPAGTNRSVIDRSYSVSWMLFFDNLEDEEVYQKHPDHLKFVENYSHLWEKVIVYDSVGKKQ